MSAVISADPIDTEVIEWLQENEIHGHDIRNYNVIRYVVACAEQGIDTRCSHDIRNTRLISSFPRQRVFYFCFSSEY